MISKILFFRIDTANLSKLMIKKETPDFNEPGVQNKPPQKDLFYY